MAVLRPLKVVITNYPDEQVEFVDVINNPEDASARARCRFRASCSSNATTSWRIRRRSSSGCLGQGSAAAVRLLPDLHRRDQDRRGEIVELRCTGDPATRGGDSPTAAR
jgi:glutaminyl-tRNA synthetase